MEDCDDGYDSDYFHELDAGFVEQSSEDSIEDSYEVDWQLQRFWKPVENCVPEPVYFYDMSPDIIKSFGLDSWDGWLFAMDAVMTYIDWCAVHYEYSQIAERHCIALECLDAMLSELSCPFPLSREFLFREACDIWEDFFHEFLRLPSCPDVPGFDVRPPHNNAYTRRATHACNAISRLFDVSKDLMRKLCSQPLFRDMMHMYEEEVPWKWFLSYAEDSKECLSLFAVHYYPYSIIFRDFIIKNRSASEGDLLQTPLLASKASVERSCERKEMVINNDVSKKPGKNARKKAARANNAVDEVLPAEPAVPVSPPVVESVIVAGSEPVPEVEEDDEQFFYYPP